MVHLERLGLLLLGAATACASSTGERTTGTSASARPITSTETTGSGRTGTSASSGTAGTASAAAATSGATSTTGAGGVPGPVHWWKLDDGSGLTAADSAGNAPGTLSSGASWGPGPSGGSVGVGGAANGSVSMAANLPGGTFTLTFWANPGAFAVGDQYQNVVLGGESYQASGFRCGFTSAGQLVFWTSQSGGSLSLQAPASAAAPAGTWSHFAIAYASGAATLYVDGQSAATASGTYLQGPASMGIDDGAGGVGDFTGSVSDLRIYDVALSPAQVAQIYGRAATGTTGASSATASTASSTTSSIAGTSTTGGGTTSAGSSTTSGSSSTGTASSSSGGTIVPAFYVATNGDDANPGTLVQPFATFGQAQAAMQASATIKTTYIRAGTYSPPAAGGNCAWGDPAGSAISLSSADSGETWSYYPPDGYGSAILDGQSTQGYTGNTYGGNGVGCGFGMSGASNVTVIGLQFQRYLDAALWANQSNDLAFLDNTMHDVTSTSSGAMFVMASPGATISNNYVYDVAAEGVTIDDNTADGSGMSDTTVANNVVRNACTWPADTSGNDEGGGDCGAYYIWSANVSTSTNIVFRNNYAQDVNVSSNGAGDFGTCCAEAIYLDDRVDNVTVVGNVATGIKSGCFLIHGGQNNAITGNLCDLGGSFNQEIVHYQTDNSTQMTGNRFTNNVVVSGGPAGASFSGSGPPPNPMTIQDNDYYDYGGGAVDSSGNGGAGGDSSPSTIDPNVSCWDPTMSPSSPVLSAPVSFPNPSGNWGGWGPPGFTLPQSGTPPSWPHGC